MEEIPLRGEGYPESVQPGARPVGNQADKNRGHQPRGRHREKRTAKAIDRFHSEDDLAAEGTPEVAETVAQGDSRSSNRSRKILSGNGIENWNDESDCERSQKSQ